jgi:hypothetical protein
LTEQHPSRASVDHRSTATGRVRHDPSPRGTPRRPWGGGFASPREHPVSARPYGSPPLHCAAGEMKP